MFDSTKTRFLLLGIAVVGLGMILGTALWLKLAPHSRLGIEQTDSANGVKQYGSVPEFTLTERDGSIVSLQQLRGKIWVADFIYTSCTDTCPLQSAMSSTAAMFKPPGTCSSAISTTGKSAVDRKSVV